MTLGVNVFRSRWCQHCCGINIAAYPLSDAIGPWDNDRHEDRFRRRPDIAELVPAPSGDLEGLRVSKFPIEHDGGVSH